MCSAIILSFRVSDSPFPPPSVFCYLELLLDRSLYYPGPRGFLALGLRLTARSRQGGSRYFNLKFYLICLVSVLYRLLRKECDIVTTGTTRAKFPCISWSHPPAVDAKGHSRFTGGNRVKWKRLLEYQQICK